MKYNGATRWSYYDNSATCGNCNGTLCRVCWDEHKLGLRQQGTTRFPLSRAINGCTPPKIGPSWRWQGQGGWNYPFRTTPHKLRAL